MLFFRGVWEVLCNVWEGYFSNPAVFLLVCVVFNLHSLTFHPGSLSSRGSLGKYREFVLCFPIVFAQVKCLPDSYMFSRYCVELWFGVLLGSSRAVVFPF